MLLVAKRSKIHHFVPQVLQRRFASNPDYVWYAEKDIHGNFKPPQLTKIKKAFQISNFYTIHVGDIPTDIVEKEFYQRIDNYLGRFLPFVHEKFGKGEVPVFEGAPLDALRKVVIEMAKRTPEFTKKYNEVEIGKRIIQSTLSKLPKSHESFERNSLLAELNDPQRLREIGRSVRVRATIGHSDLIENSLKDFSVRWAISESRQSFILSSLMVYRIGNGGSNGLSNPNMEMWMPIGPKIALVLVRDAKIQIPLKVSESAEHIRQVNEHAVSNSKQIASHSKELIESLTGVKAVEPRFPPASLPRSDQTAPRY